MQNIPFHVRVIPDVNKDRFIVRTISAPNATEAASSVLRQLREGPVDCIEVKPFRQDHKAARTTKAAGKVAFYDCLYGIAEGFVYQDRFTVAS